MDTKLIEELQEELDAHSAALEKAAELCEAQAVQIKELEAENSEAADHVGRAEMAEQAMTASVMELESALKNLLAIKAAKDAQGDSPAYRAAKNFAWKTAEHLVGPQPIRADLDCPQQTLASESQREAAESADEKPDGQAENVKVSDRPS